MAEKIYKIQKELEEKRRSRLQKQIISQAPIAGQGTQQPGLPQPNALGPRQQSEYWSHIMTAAGGWVQWYIILPSLKVERHSFYILNV